jgi:uncharacterized protein
MFSQETGSETIVSWIESNTTRPPVMSPWNVTEFSAALSFKYIQGQIDMAVKDASLRKLHLAQSNLFRTVAVEDEDFTRAATFANQHGLRLRGGDALHLSIASGRHLRILTLDKRMAAAANTLGIGVVELP